MMAYHRGRCWHCLWIATELLWVGTEQGLAFLHGGAWIPGSHLLMDRRSDGVSYLFEDSQTDLVRSWRAYEGGVSAYEEGDGSPQDVQEYLPHPYLNAMLEMTTVPLVRDRLQLLRRSRHPQRIRLADTQRSMMALLAPRSVTFSVTQAVPSGLVPSTTGSCGWARAPGSWVGGPSPRKRDWRGWR